jgi:intein-encoded DNA endonuclease-like protein
MVVITRKLPLEERLRLYEQAIRLRNEKGWGRRRIGKALGISTYTVDAWLNKGIRPSTRKGTKLSLETRMKISESVKRAMWKPEIRKKMIERLREAMKRPEVREKLKQNALKPERIQIAIQNLPKDVKREKNPRWIRPKLDPSPALAYVLGVIKGDGSAYLYKGWGRITLETTTPEFNKSFEEALREIGLNPRTYRIVKKQPNRKMTFMTVATSTAFVEWYKSLTVDDLRRILSTSDLKRAFIRGFYESEGNISSPARNCWRVSLFNTNFELLCFVKELLASLGIEQIHIRTNSSFRRSTPCFSLDFARRKSVQAFFSQISPCIKLPPTKFWEVKNGVA